MTKQEADLFVLRSAAVSARKWAARLKPTDIAEDATPQEMVRVRAALIEFAQNCEALVSAGRVLEVHTGTGKSVPQ